MSTRRFNRLTRRLPSIRLWRLLRDLILAMVCFWANNSEGAGCLKRGTLFVVQYKVIHVMEKTASGKYEITRQLDTGIRIMRAITVDEVHGFVYWSDYAVGKVRRATLDNSNQRDIYSVRNGIGFVHGLGVNPEEDKLYISDSGGRKIVVTSLDGGGGRTLINCTGKPQGLVLDLSKRLLFHSTYDPSRVYKASLDGTEVTEMVSINLFDIYGLAMNGPSRICWADFGKKTIECCSFSGGERRTVHNTTGKPKYVTIQDGVAFYTQHSPNSVRSVPLTGGTDTVHDTGSYSSNYFWGIAILQGDHNCTETGIKE